MAWLDPAHHDRILAHRQGLPEPAGVDRQGRRRHHHALVRGHPAVQRARVQDPAAPTGGSRGQPARLADHARRPGTVLRQGREQHRQHAPQRPQAAAGQQQLQGAGRTGAERSATSFYATGPYGTNAEPYDGRPASIQDGFNFQGDKNKSKWSTLVSGIPQALAHRQSGPAAELPRRADHPRQPGGRADARAVPGRRRQPAAAEGPDRLRRRQRHRDPPAAAAVRQRAVPGRAGQLLGPGRPELHAAHHRFGLRHSSTSR